MSERHRLVLLEQGEEQAVLGTEEGDEVTELLDEVLAAEVDGVWKRGGW